MSEDFICGECIGLVFIMIVWASGVLLMTLGVFVAATMVLKHAESAKFSKCSNPTVKIGFAIPLSCVPSVERAAALFNETSLSVAMGRYGSNLLLSSCPSKSRP